MHNYRKELCHILLEEKETGLRWTESHTIESSVWDVPYKDIAEQIGLTSDYIIIDVTKTGILHKD